MNLNTILYWHKLEHFYPYMLSEQNDKKIKSFYISGDYDFENMMKYAAPEGTYIRYYEVYLGIFKVDSALDIISKKLSAGEEFRDLSDETSCICKLRVYPGGSFDSKSFKVSSFPWAIQRVKEDGVDLNRWDEEFQEFQRNLYFCIFDANKKVTYGALRRALDEIEKKLNWDIVFDQCWMRIDRVIGRKSVEENATAGIKITEANEEAGNSNNEEYKFDENEAVDELIKSNDLLNSFYARDLERIINQIENGHYGEALDTYIGQSQQNKIAPKKRIEIEKEQDYLFKIFNPKYFPMGKWPSGYSLRAMQQVSVNLSMSENLCNQKVFSINGPPGTGKTTLLRDIVAAKVVERAIKLMDLDEPDNIFGNTIGTLEYGGFTSQIKEIKEAYRDGGILVASNNNAAIRNISEELPEKEALARRYRNATEYEYFSSLSNRIYKKETWGMCAATLGNRRNVRKFIDDFWPISNEEDSAFDFNKYLRERHRGKDENRKREYINKWNQAKKRFKQCYEEVLCEYKEAVTCYELLEQQIEKEALIETIEKKRKEKEKEYEAEIKRSENETNCLGKAQEWIEKNQLEMGKIKRNTVFFSIRYLLSNLFKGQLEIYKTLERETFELLKEKWDREKKLTLIVENIERIQSEIEKLTQKTKILKTELQQHRQDIREWEATHKGCKIPDEEYLSALLDDKDLERKKEAQSVSPWNWTGLTELREKLFLEAMHLHEVLVETSGQMRTQLDSFGKLLRNMTNSEQDKRFAATLYQSFQIVVPVISTTFASIGSLLRYVGQESFGLLLIDEAGQAMPQSAVGAIWRSKKCVIVGDPLQIEPVVTIYERIIEYLRKHFNQTSWLVSKDTSVQSLADECNRYGGYRCYDDDKAPLWVGSPLLIHGRCQKPIFEIANRIAYANKMIYGTGDKPGVICQWIDVKGQAESKHFVKRQAEEVLELILTEFTRTKEQGKDVPLLFVITPFRSVKAGLINYLREENLLYNKLYPNKWDKTTAARINQWISNNIGTIHTFQGKESDSVILCLGVGSGKSGEGAIAWAGSRPNILNVAVTRAKQRLYIVGDKDKWTKARYFKIAYDICERNKKLQG